MPTVSADVVGRVRPVFGKQAAVLVASSPAACIGAQVDELHEDTRQEGEGEALQHARYAQLVEAHQTRVARDQAEEEEEHRATQCVKQEAAHQRRRPRATSDCGTRAQAVEQMLMLGGSCLKREWQRNAHDKDEARENDVGLGLKWRVALKIKNVIN